MILRASARLMARIKFSPSLAMPDKLPEIASLYQPPPARCYHVGMGHAPGLKESFMVHPRPAAPIAPLVALALLPAALRHAGPAGAAALTPPRSNSFPH